MLDSTNFSKTIVEPATVHKELLTILEDYKEVLGSEFLETLRKFTLIKSKHESCQTPQAAWWLLLLFIETIASEDPFWFHHEIARKVLENDSPDVAPERTAVDLLARELVETCRALNAALQTANEQITKQTIPIEQLLIQNDLLLWDAAYIKLLINAGMHGKRVSQGLPAALQTFYHESNLLSFWLDPIEKGGKSRFFLSPAFLLLGEVLWKDSVQQRWEKQTKNVPALTQAVLISTIHPSLNKDTKIEVVESGDIRCFSENGQLAYSVPVPCLDPDLVNLVFRGFKAMGNLTSHKLIRWQVQTGFFNWANDVPDPRRICVTGGYEAVARAAGCGESNKFSTEVKAILHAQAHGRFNLPQGGCGNMISLRQGKLCRNHEPSEIIIILGDMLLPNFTHHLQPGGKRRLIPITDLPPLIGSPNTHAGQAMLQLLILEEFSNQSDRLATHNSIYLPEEAWKKLAKQARLTDRQLPKIIAGWIEDDFFYKAFLQRDGDEYTLGPTYGKVMNFLHYQGQQRLQGAIGGAMSAEAKKERARRGYKTIRRKAK